MIIIFTIVQKNIEINNNNNNNKLFKMIYDIISAAVLVKPCYKTNKHDC